MNYIYYLTRNSIELPQIIVSALIGSGESVSTKDEKSTSIILSATPLPSRRRQQKVRSKFTVTIVWKLRQISYQGRYKACGQGKPQQTIRH